MTSTHYQCISLLKSCKTLNHLKQLHAFASKAGLETDHFIGGKFIVLVAITLADGIDYAYCLFFHFPSPDTYMYNSLIRCFSESDHPRHLHLIFNQMRQHLITPDSFSFAFLLKAAANLKSLDAECSCVESSRKVFDEMPEPNVVSWNAVITACFRSNDVKGAGDLFNVTPLQNLWNLMLADYTKAGELESARRAFFEMPKGMWYLGSP